MTTISRSGVALCLGISAVALSGCGSGSSSTPTSPPTESTVKLENLDSCALPAGATGNVLCGVLLDESGQPRSGVILRLAAQAQKVRGESALDDSGDCLTNAQGEYFCLIPDTYTGAQTLIEVTPEGEVATEWSVEIPLAGEDVVPTWMVSARVDGNSEFGTIQPAIRYVAYGQPTTFEVVANQGYEVDQISGCSGSLSLEGESALWTTAAITQACVVRVSFKEEAQQEDPDMNWDDANTPWDQSKWN